MDDVIEWKTRIEVGRMKSNRKSYRIQSITRRITNNHPIQSNAMTMIWTHERIEMWRTWWVWCSNWVGRNCSLNPSLISPANGAVIGTYPLALVCTHRLAWLLQSSWPSCLCLYIGEIQLELIVTPSHHPVGVEKGPTQGLHSVEANSHREKESFQPTCTKRLRSSTKMRNETIPSIPIVSNKLITSTTSSQQRTCHYYFLVLSGCNCLIVSCCLVSKYVFEW